MGKIKRIVCLLAAFVMTAGLVTGCALLERDLGYYNGLVVATVGDNIKITKAQLVAAYNSYGSQYVSQQGMSGKNALEKTLNDLIDREILVELAIQNFSYPNMTDAEKAAHIKSLRGKKGAESLFYDALYENEKAEVRKSSFKALNEYFVQLQDKVRKERGLIFTTPENATDPNIKNAEPAMDPLSIFSPLVKRNPAGYNQDENGNEVFVPANTIFSMDISAYVNKEPHFTVSSVGGTDEITWLVPEQWTADIDEDGDSIVRTVKTEALKNLVRALGDNERGMRNLGTAGMTLVAAVPNGAPGYLTDKERAIIGRELGRMIEDYSKTVLTQRYQEIFDLGIDKPIDRSLFKKSEDYETAIRAVVAANFTQNGRAGALASRAQSYYRSQVLSQYNRFLKKMDTKESLTSKIMENLDGTFWLPKDVAESHFTVSHILIQYNDEQKAELEKIKSEFAEGGYVNVDNYNSRLQALAGKLSVRARDEKGVEYGEPVSATEIRDQLMAALGDSSINRQFVPQDIGGMLKNGSSIIVPALVANGGKSEQERLGIFRDFIYKYNQDPGMNNPNFEYVMSVENTKMVAEFTDASRELFGYMRKYRMNNGEPVLDENDKPLYDWVKREASFKPKKSSMTYELVMSEFGAHIIMYTRNVGDFIYNSDTSSFINFASVESDLDSMINNHTDFNYLFAPLTSYGNTFGLAEEGKVEAPAKTMFDVVVEKMNKPAFEAERSSRIMNFKNAREGGTEDGKLLNKIKIFRGNFKDLIG